MISENADPKIPTPATIQIPAFPPGILYARGVSGCV
jgi:hypothetical protein